MSTTDQIMNRCFEKHPFEELNSIDYNMLYTTVKLYLTKFPSTGKHIFFDIGCNAGSFVRVLKDIGITQYIHCFEPHPVLSQKVIELYPHVIMNKFCIGSSNDNIDIHIPMHSVGLSSIINRPVFSKLGQEIAVVNVKCQTIDAYCAEHNIDTIDFIKIDVEGAEKHVFMGASVMLAAKKIKSGIFEVGQTLIDAGTSAEELCTLLESYGYTIIKNISSSDYFFHI